MAVCLGHAQKPPLPDQDWSTRPVIKVWPGVAPGSEHDDRKEATAEPSFAPGMHVVINVTSPTLTVFQPKSGNSTGTAVLICPGGAFRMLSIENEGFHVADWFAQHGVTAFVLKYRLADAPPLHPPPTESLEDNVKRLVETLPKEEVPMAIADGVQAIRVMRANAGRYGFRPDRIVAVGFSAGGGVVTGTAAAPIPADRPNYVASIYGALPLTEPTPPAGAPPFFLALAEDDPLVPPMVMRLFTSLRDAGGKPEFHLYRSGNHGFSMRELGTSDHWLEELWWWMRSFGLTIPGRDGKVGAP
jgi:acetyl esterase/lipase